MSCHQQRRLWCWCCGSCSCLWRSWSDWSVGCRWSCGFRRCWSNHRSFGCWQSRFWSWSDGKFSGCRSKLNTLQMFSDIFSKKKRKQTSYIQNCAIQTCLHRSTRCTRHKLDDHKHDDQLHKKKSTSGALIFHSSAFFS